MSSPLRSMLVVMTLLSQVLGGAAVLCVESDGSLLLEFQVGECCGPVEDGGSGEVATEEAGDCGTCQDLSLAQRVRCEQEQDDLGLALGMVSSLAPVACPPSFLPGFDAQRPPDPHRGWAARATGDLVSETVVLTC